MNTNLKLIFVYIFISLQFNSFSQSDNSFIYGGNIGVKFGSKHYAARYRGIYQNQLENYFANPIYYQQVRASLGNKDFFFYDYGNVFKYTPSILFGIMIGYQTSPNLSFDMDANFIIMNAITGYTLEVIDPGNQTSQGNYLTGYIAGKESRFNGRINMNYTFDSDSDLRLIVGLSGLFNAWRIDDHLIELNGSILANLHSQFNTNNNFALKVNGNGFGYGVNTGFSYPINDHMSMQILYQPYLLRAEYFTTKAQIEIAGNDYVKPVLRLEHDFVARFVF